MPKRSPNYILVIVMLVAAMCLTYWARSQPVTKLNPADLSSLPTTIGAWTKNGDDASPDEDTLKGWEIKSQDFLKRTYLGPDRVPMELLVIYKGLGRRGWHMSELCFTGSGYNVTQSYTNVPYAGRSVRAVKLLAQQNGSSPMIAVYMLVQGKAVESNFMKQQVRMALGKLHPSKDGWAYVRVTSPVVGSEEGTMKSIRGFLSAASDPLLKALTGSGERASTR
jgi:EpsI family protein